MKSELGVVAPAFAFLAGPAFIDLKRGEAVQSLRLEQGYNSRSFYRIMFQVQAFQFGQTFRLGEFLEADIGHPVFIEIEVLDVFQQFTLRQFRDALISQTIVIQIEPAHLFHCGSLPEETGFFRRQPEAAQHGLVAAQAALKNGLDIGKFCSRCHGKLYFT